MGFRLQSVGVWGRGGFLSSGFRHRVACLCRKYPAALPPPEPRLLVVLSRHYVIIRSLLTTAVDV